MSAGCVLESFAFLGDRSDWYRPFPIVPAHDVWSCSIRLAIIGRQAQGSMGPKAGIQEGVEQQRQSGHLPPAFSLCEKSKLLLA